MAKEPLYPHVGIQEKSDMPRGFRVAPDRTISMISKSYRGYVGKATPVYDEVFTDMIGRTPARGGVALDAMFKTFNPSYILFRRVLGSAVKATSGTSGFKVTTAPTADGSFTVQVGAALITVAVLSTDANASVAQKIASAINNTIAAPALALHVSGSDTVTLQNKLAGTGGNSTQYQARLSVDVPTAVLTFDADIETDNVVKLTVNGTLVTVPFNGDQATTMADLAAAADAATADVASAVVTSARVVTLTGAPGVTEVLVAMQASETMYVTGGTAQADLVVTTGTATVGTGPASLVVTPTTVAALVGGVDGPKAASVTIATSDAAINWTVVWNFPGVNGHDGAINVLAPGATKALFSMQLVDTFDSNKVTKFTDLAPVANQFVNDGSPYGMRYLGVNHPLISVYYNGDLTQTILAPNPPVGDTLPVAPPVLPAAHYTLAGGDDGPTTTVDDYLAVIAASRFDRSRVVLCPDDDLSAADKRAINAALKEQAVQSVPLTGCRQAVTMLPFGDSLTDDLAANGDALGRVVAGVARHTCSFRNDQKPFSYTDDIFIAAAMTTKKLWLSLADRTSVPAVNGVTASSFNGNEEFSLDNDALNPIWETGHEAVVYDPGTKAFQFLTGRALNPDQDSEWSRANNRQLEDQFRMDIYFMLQRFKSSPIKTGFSVLISGLDRYLRYWRDDVGAVESIQGTVGDASNNPPDRIQAGFARVDCHWAPLQIMDNIDCVIHTYLDTTL